MTRILIIEDDDLVRDYLAEVLQRADYQVHTAADGQAGVDLCRTQPMDLVITDILMPEKDGIETILDLRRDNPGLKVMAISGGGRSGPDSYLNSARLLGADLTMKKPFSNQELLSAVAELLDRDAAAE